MQDKINNKNTRPTPRSINHKKPTKISKLSYNNIKPKIIKNKPNKYHKVIRFVVNKNKKEILNKIV